jgi:putative ABC transport system permease protein
MRRAVRALTARPGFTIVAVATLAIGFGVNAAIFSITRSMLLRPLPYRDADRLVQVFEELPAEGLKYGPITPASYARWRDRVDAFEQTAGFLRVAMNVATSDFAVQVEAFRVSPSFFPLLGVEPAIGRGFTDEDAQPGHDHVVLLNDGFWRRRFGGDPHIVGQSIDVDGTPCTVIGVLPASFKIFRILNHELDIFRPFILNPNEREQAMNLWAKLRPGATIELARAQLKTVYATLPMTGRRWTADAVLYQQRASSGSRPMVVMLESAVGLVLLIGCANVANLLLAVAAGRRKELAVRLALGASRWNVVKDLGCESLLLTIAGGGVAILLSVWAVAMLNSVVSYQDINRFEPFRVDRWVVAFTIALAAAIAIVFGLLPIRTADSVDVVDALKESAPGATAGPANRRLRQALVIAEVALAIVLAASAVVLTRSASALHGLPRGVAVDRVMTAQVALNDPAYADPRRLVRAADAIVQRLRASPGIEVAALVNYPPLAMIRVGVPVVAEGVPPSPDGRTPIARYFVTAPEYFRAAGIPLGFGRDFTSSDDVDHQRVAIVSERFARRFWNSSDVVGRRVMAKFPHSDAFWVPRSKDGWLTIVGVARDVNEDGIPDSAGFPQIYLPYAQAPTPVVTMIAKTSGAPPATAAPLIRAAVRNVDPHLPVSYEMTYDEMVRDTFSRPREMAWIIGTFAMLALLLSAIGVYGVMTYVTTARTREIGIRMALGASRGDIVAMIVGDALRPTAAGVAIGVAATPFALQLARGLLFGVGPFDPRTLAIVAAGLGLVSTAASAIPAFRAARGGEVVALRSA